MLNLIKSSFLIQLHKKLLSKTPIRLLRAVLSRLKEEEQCMLVFSLLKDVKQCGMLLSRLKDECSVSAALTSARNESCDDALTIAMRVTSINREACRRCASVAF